MGELKPPSTRTRALRESDGGNEGVEDKERGGGGGTPGREPSEDGLRSR